MILAIAILIGFIFVVSNADAKHSDTDHAAAMAAVTAMAWAICSQKGPSTDDY